MQQLSLKRKMLFFVFIICVVPLFFSGTFINSLVLEKLQADYQMRSEESMKQIHLQIKEGLISPSYKAITLLARNNNTINLARTIGSRVILRSSELDPEDYRYLVTFCETYSDLAGVGLGTDSGGYFNYPDTVLDISYDPRTRLWYKKGMSNPGSPLLTDAYMRTDGKIVIAVAHAFSGEGVNGVIVAGWSLQVLEDAVRKITSKNNASTIVLNQSNKIVVSHDYPEWLLKTAQDLDIQGFDELLNRSNSFHRIYIGDKEKVLFVSVSDDTGWKVVSMIDSAALAAESRKITRNITFAFVITLTFILLGLYYLARSITHPIEGLVANAQDIVSGNFGTKLSLDRRDELGTLAGSINQIVDDLKDKCDKIHFQAEQLQKREIEYRTLVENAQDIIVRSDSNHLCEYINPVIKAYTGIEADEIIGQDITKSGVSHEVCLLIKNTWRYVLEANKERWDTFEIEGSGGERLYFEIHAVPEHSPDGTVETVLSIIRNITQQKQMEKQIARLERLHLVGEIAASIGHEVRNPLTVVRGFLQMMQQGKNANPSKEHLSLMVEEIDRACGIINEFLSMAKNKSVHLSMENLNSIILAIIPLLQANAIARNSRIDLRLEEVPELPLDGKEIRQLLLNLVSNGLEAMLDGGLIIIRTCYYKRRVILTVEDNGGGLPDYVIDRFGIPFTTTKPNGVGLGLSICLSIAARHNAKIDFQTSAKGTKICVIFPVKFKEKSKGGMV